MNLLWNSVHGEEGAHYNVFSAAVGLEMEGIRGLFPDGTANKMNFILFSTSGVHGTYNTIEEAEAHIKNPEDEELQGEVTFVIVQPRLCCLRYGNCKPQTHEDICFLKKLRQSSWEAIAEIGNPPNPANALDAG